VKKERYTPQQRATKRIRQLHQKQHQHTFVFAIVTRVLVSESADVVHDQAHEVTQPVRHEKCAHLQQRAFCFCARTHAEAGQQSNQ
jgi:hypothetical protein